MSRWTSTFFVKISESNVHKGEKKAYRDQIVHRAEASGIRVCMHRSVHTFD